MDVFFRNDEENEKNFWNSIRPIHTVSLYLLGISMHEMFENELKEYMKSFIIDLQEWYDFRYTWFLTCFYHDIVSCEEAAKYNMEDLKDNLKYTIYNFKLSNGDDYKPYFPQDVINNYWKFRNQRDHGIGAGYYFFNSLCNNFKSETENQFIESNEAIIHGLSWRKEHLDHFAYIADAIICHNIWYAYEKKSMEKYKKYKLNKLIINCKEDRLYFKQNPLHFILCLLDTIEPIKKFEEIKVEEIMKSISIESSDEEIIRIEYKKEFQEENSKKFELWENAMRDLENWLGVMVNKKDNVMYIKILL